MRRLMLVLIVVATATVSAQQTLQQQYALSQDATFIGRVQVSIVRAAIAIINESPNVANHTRRANWAGLVLRQPETFAKRMALGVATDGTITAVATDAAINSRVDAVWNAYAGVE